MNRILLIEIIDNLGFEHFEAANGKEALEIIIENDIDIVLMDIEMPVMNGLETTRYIRTKFDANKKDIPIIALTAHNPNDFFNDFQVTGFNKLLTKPYSISRISTVLSDFV